MVKTHLKLLSLAFLMFHISSSYAVGPLRLKSPLSPQKTELESLIVKANVFDELDKKPIGEERFKAPYLYIGKLFSPDNSFSCTASLIAQNFILTSAHCLVDENNKEILDLFTFKLGYHYGHFNDEAKAEIVDFGSIALKNLYTKSDKVPDGTQLVGDENDWALLKIKKPLGKKYGHFNLHSPSSIKNEVNRNITQAGYGVAFEGRGQEITAHKNCNIRKYRKGGALIDTDCEISKGDSGSPLFKCTKELGCVVLGVVAGQVKPKGALEGADTYIIDRYYDSLSNKAAGSIMIEHALDEALFFDQN